jgi:hypothetical protein
VTTNERNFATLLLDKIEPALPDTEAVARGACALLRDMVSEVHGAASHAPKRRRARRTKGVDAPIPAETTGGLVG